MILELGTAIKCPHFYFLFTFIMANPAYDQALTTGKVVIRKWWFNTNSTKNQMSVQFQQEVERPASNASAANSLLISVEQGTEGLGTHTRVTALRSFDANRAAQVLGSREGDATMGSPVMFAEDFYQKLGVPAGTQLSIQVTENFTKNPYSKSQSPKINPSTSEVVVATNPETGTQMAVYRHTDLVLAANCEHTFVAAEAVVKPAMPDLTQQFAGTGGIVS